MKKNSTYIKHKFGIDGAVFFTLMSKIIQSAGGVFILVFITKFLNEVEQGYYFTFGSILAIQIFFELGLSTIISQYVAHENVNLLWQSNSHFTGSKQSVSRLSSILRFTVKWFSIIGILLFIGLLITGFAFFSYFNKNETIVDWESPWIIISITTSLSLMVAPLLAFFEGLGKVKEVAKIKMLQQIIQLFFVLALFTFGFKLFSAPLAAIFSFTVIPIWILLSDKLKLLIFVWNKLSEWRVNYWFEIFPFQWKIAVSWISGYFIFQFFNPVLFATEGAIIAGQMGITLAILNSIFALSFSWISTKNPVFSGLIAQKKYKTLDVLFDRTLLQSSLFNAFGLIGFFIIIFVFRLFEIKMGEKNFADRFLSFLPMLFMMISILLNHIIGSWASYLRCHKKEPMLIHSIVYGSLSILSTITLGLYFGVLGITAGYALITFCMTFWAYYIFKTKKQEWHKNEI